MFTGLEPIDDTQPAATFTVNASSGDNTINVVNPTAGPAGRVEVNFIVNNVPQFELVRFRNKTNVVVNGLAGSDIINLNYDATVAALFNTLTVDGGAGADTINVLVDHEGDLIGGSENDRFVLADGVTLTGSIDGGTVDTDTLDYSDFSISSPVAIDLANMTATSVTAGFTGIDSVIGGKGTDTLTAANSNNTINITSLNAGNIGGTFRFADFENLNGGSDNDEFVFSAGASITGAIDGFGNINTLNYGAYTAAVSVNLQNSTATGVSGFMNIDNINGGNGSATDTITGPDAATTWDINAAEAGTVSGVNVNYSEFESLVGGSGDDLFDISVSGALTFSINGGAQATVAGDVVNFMNAGAGVSVDVSLLSNIEGLVDSGNNNDSIVGTSGVDTILITHMDDGTINGIAFTDWENIDGAGDNDVFTLTTVDSSLTGILAGGAGTDTFSASGITAPVGFTLSEADSNGFDGDADVLVGTFTDIESLTGGSGADSLTGLDRTSIWTVNTTNSYAASGQTLSFTAIATLTGRSMVDTFN
jgi:hypothetical protein